MPVRHLIRALHSARVSEVTTKRGLASSFVHSAFATTRRWRLQLLRVIHLKSLKRLAVTSDGFDPLVLKRHTHPLFSFGSINAAQYLPTAKVEVVVSRRLNAMNDCRARGFRQSVALVACGDGGRHYAVDADG
jgi:hypothetical protein